DCVGGDGARVSRGNHAERAGAHFRRASGFCVVAAWRFHSRCGGAWLSARSEGCIAADGATGADRYFFAAQFIRGCDGRRRWGRAGTAGAGAQGEGSIRKRIAGAGSGEVEGCGEICVRGDAAGAGTSRCVVRSRGFVKEHGDANEATTARRWVQKLEASGKIETPKQEARKE